MQYNAVSVKQDSVIRKKMKRDIWEDTADSHASVCKSVISNYTKSLKPCVFVNCEIALMPQSFQVWFEISQHQVLGLLTNVLDNCCIFSMSLSKRPFTEDCQIPIRQQEAILLMVNTANL